MVSIGHTRCTGVMPITYNMTVQTIPKHCLRLQEGSMWQHNSVGRRAIFEQLMVDVHEPVHCDTTMKITNKMHYID